MLIYSPCRINDIKDYMLKTQIFNVEFVSNKDIYSTAYNFEEAPHSAEFIMYKTHENMVVTNDICVKNTFNYRSNPNDSFNIRVSNKLIDMITSSVDITLPIGIKEPFYNKWFKKPTNETLLDKIFKINYQVDWMLVSIELYSEIKKDTSFTETNQIDTKKQINRVGYIYRDGILIYIFIGVTTPSEIYLGEFDSIRTKVCDEIQTKSDNSKDVVTFNYRMIKGSRKIIKYII